MRCLLVAVLVSACGSTTPLQAGAGVEYPRGPYVLSPDPCARVQPGFVRPLACDARRH